MKLLFPLPRSLAAMALAAPLAQAADPGVLRIGDQNYCNAQASVEACGALTQNIDTSRLDTSFNEAFD